jgi:hypothetical protein
MVQVFWDSDIGYCVKEVDYPEGRVQQIELPRDADIETRNAATFSIAWSR